jgi:hypothetical protein
LHWSAATGASLDELKGALDALVADAVRIGGPGHQVAFAARNQLLSLRLKEGEDVTDELEQVVRAASDRFDAEDELMLTLRTNLLTVKGAKGDPAARRELRELLRVVESRLGAAHLLNAVIRQNLSVQPVVPQPPQKLSDCDWSAASPRDPPIRAATWIARVTVVTAPERLFDSRPGANKPWLVDQLALGRPCLHRRCPALHPAARIAPCKRS